MLQVVRIDIAKIDRDVAHVQWLYTYASSVCSKCFILSDVCYKYFHQDVVKIDLDVTYTCMLQTYFK
jgi:hypothetical protein